MNPIEYLNSTVFCTLQPSHIHGVGVFAIRRIPKGIPITDHTIDFPNNTYFDMRESEFKYLLPEIKSLILDRTNFDAGTPLRFISPNSQAVLQSFMNHSDTPNTDGRKTLRTIQKGEELTEDFTKLCKEPHPLTQKHMTFIWK